MFVVYLHSYNCVRKIISSECSLFLGWFRHWSKCLVIHLVLPVSNLPVDCNVTCGIVGFLGLGNVRLVCIGEIL